MMMLVSTKNSSQHRSPKKNNCTVLSSIDSQPLLRRSQSPSRKSWENRLIVVLLPTHRCLVRAVVMASKEECRWRRRQHQELRRQWEQTRQTSVRLLLLVLVHRYRHRLIQQSNVRHLIRLLLLRMSSAVIQHLRTQHTDYIITNGVDIICIHRLIL